MPEKILVIQTAFLGDAILSLPFIQELKKKTNARIDVVTIPENKEIFASCPETLVIRVIDKNDTDNSLWATIGFALSLRQFSYSKIYSLHRSFRSTLIAFLAGVKETYGYDSSSFAFAYKHTVPYRKDYHEVQRHLVFLKDNDLITNWRVLPEMLVNQDQYENLQRVILGLKKDNRIIAIAPGSVWQTKRYPDVYYLKIIDYFCNTGFNIVLLGGKNEMELCNRLTVNKRVHNLAGKISIVESRGVIGYAELLLTNDSASTHIGMAANAKTLTIYCSTVPEFGFYPYNEKSDIISYTGLDCKPCGIHGHIECPLGHFNCAHLLKPELVIEKMEKMIEGK